MPRFPPPARNEALVMGLLFKEIMVANKLTIPYITRPYLFRGAALGGKFSFLRKLLSILPQNHSAAMICFQVSFDCSASLDQFNHGMITNSPLQKASKNYLINTNVGFHVTCASSIQSTSVFTLGQDMPLPHRPWDKLETSQQKTLRKSLCARAALSYIEI